MDAQWIYRMTEATALIVAFLLLLRFVLGRVSTGIDCLKQTNKELLKTLEKINIAMTNRDQIILNHLEHVVESQQMLVNAIERLCKEWGINGGKQ